MDFELQKNFLWRWWRGIDQQTIIALALLFAFSLMLVTTSSPAVASRIGLEESYFSTRQFAYLSFAAIVIFVLSFMDKTMIKRTAVVGFLLSIILLIFVKFFGYDVKGARRWINLFGFSMQPSEFLKPCFSVMTAWILSMRNSGLPSFTITIGLYAIIAAILITQPDFGMLIMITMVMGIQLFISGLPLLWILIAMFAGTVGIFGAYTMLPHVAQRINSFLDPSGSENYQVTKSIAAFANGGFYGRGPGEGSVKQVLPDSHTDFIFAVAGEEFGAIVCLIIAAIFAFIVVRGLIMLIYEEDRFTILASVGLLSQFGLQAFINMGVTLNLLPTKGMTLPFISYGGCSTLAVAIGMGMLLALTREHTSLTKYKAQILEL